MATIEKDEVRENRISDEAIVDCYGPEEQAMGWYYYLDDKIQFPFKARCVQHKSISPLQIDEEVTVIGMANEADCTAEMFVKIEWGGRKFGVPLAQLQGIAIDNETEEAISDWQYWVGRGYLLCG